MTPSAGRTTAVDRQGRSPLALDEEPGAAAAARAGRQVPAAVRHVQAVAGGALEARDPGAHVEADLYGRQDLRSRTFSPMRLDGDLHDRLVARLRYFDGHSDTLGLLADATFLASAARALADPFRGTPVDKVAGIEARGFILATAVALELEAGFVAIRKPGGIHPGPKAELTAPRGWRGDETMLRLQRHVVGHGDRVLVVDDWAETGSKAITARRLIETCGGCYAGLSLLVDQLPARLRKGLAPVAAVAFAEELRDDTPSRE